MTSFTPGQRVRIVEMPPAGEHLKGQVATILQMGPFKEPGDIMVQTESGKNLMLHDHQVAPVEE